MAPGAKMNQQRNGRFRTAKEAKREREDGNGRGHMTTTKRGNWRSNHSFYQPPSS